jgi:hypothetical protein
MEKSSISGRTGMNSPKLPDLDDGSLSIELFVDITEFNKYGDIKQKIQELGGFVFIPKLPVVL